MNDDEFRSNLGGRMRRSRIATWGPVQKACADALKVTPSQISRWERGESLPRITELIRFAHACNVTFEELIGPTKPAATQLLIGLEADAQSAIVDLVEIIRKKTLEAARRRKKRAATGRRS